MTKLYSFISLSTFFRKMLIRMKNQNLKSSQKTKALKKREGIFNMNFRLIYSIRFKSLLKMVYFEINQFQVMHCIPALTIIKSDCEILSQVKKLGDMLMFLQAISMFFLVVAYFLFYTQKLSLRRLIKCDTHHHCQGNRCIG